jgi:hypothetical protein
MNLAGMQDYIFVAFSEMWEANFHEKALFVKVDAAAAVNTQPLDLRFGPC